MTVATNSWLGGAAAQAKVQSYLFAGTWVIGETITITIGSKSYTYTIASATIATFLDALVTAYNALSTSTYPELREQTASRATATLSLTANTAGKPFAATISTNSVSGTVDSAASSTGTTATANAGPYSAATAANWSQGRIPASTLSAPVQANPSASSGGSLAETATYWVITATGPNGETVKSNEKTLTLSGGNDTAHLSWAQVPNATGYRVYRSTSSGTYGSSSLVATITSGSTLTYVDTGTSLTAGQPPGSSTALGDIVVVDREGSRIKYDMDQSAITASQIRIVASDVEIGLPKTNTDSGTSYPEYRGDYWQMSSPIVYVDTDSSMIKLDFGSIQTAFEMDSSGSARNNVPATLLKGTHSSNVWNISSGNAGIAYFDGETASVATLNLGSKATVTLGTGCTNTTLNNFGGKLFVNSAIGTALNHPSTNGGTTTISGTGAVAQITMQSGTCNYNTTGALGGNTVLANGSLLTFDGDQQVKTVQNPITLYSSQAQVKDSNGVVTSDGSTKTYTLKYSDCVNSHTPKSNVQAVYTPL